MSLFRVTVPQAWRSWLQRGTHPAPDAKLRRAEDSSSCGDVLLSRVRDRVPVVGSCHAPTGARSGTSDSTLSGFQVASSHLPQGQSSSPGHVGSYLPVTSPSRGPAPTATWLMTTGRPGGDGRRLPPVMGCHVRVMHGAPPVFTQPSHAIEPSRGRFRAVTVTTELPTCPAPHGITCDVQPRPHGSEEARVSSPRAASVLPAGRGALHSALRCAGA